MKLAVDPVFVFVRRQAAAPITEVLEERSLTAEITAIQHRKHRSLGNPYILMENRQVTFQSEDFSDALLGYDHLHIDLKDVKKICCTMSDKRVRFARYREYSYLKRLKTLY